MIKRIDDYYAVKDFYYNHTEIQSIRGITTEFRFECAYMDADIKKEVYRDMTPCTEQEFVNEYYKRHFKKFGVKFPAKRPDKSSN